ncbi:hypothetical protein ACJX0J_019359, partial [Zea mays]
MNMLAFASDLRYMSKIIRFSFFMLEMPLHGYGLIEVRFIHGTRDTLFLHGSIAQLIYGFPQYSENGKNVRGWDIQPSQSALYPESSHMSNKLPGGLARSAFAFVLGLKVLPPR